MSAGGINVQQPLVGAPPNAVGAPGASLAPTTVAGPITAATPLTSPAATTATGFDAAAVPATAAWNDAWAAKFREAGAPSAVIQQLHFTGGMGADEQKLQSMLDEIKGQIDSKLATFAHDHPREFKKLAAVENLYKWVDPSSPESNRAALVMIAQGLEGGQIDDTKLEELANSAGKSAGKNLFDTLVKPFVVWSLIPGWGALRLGFAPFTGGRDILTGEKMFGTPMNTAMSIAMGVGGGITLWNNARGAMQVAQGYRMIGNVGSDAAQIAAREGLTNLSMGKKVLSYVPGTKLNQQLAGLSRLDDLKAGIAQLDGAAKVSASNVYRQIVNGDVLLMGDSASKLTKLGYQPNTRGFLMGHIMGKKPASTLTTLGTRPELHFDLRTIGKAGASNLAMHGMDLADDAAKLAMGKQGLDLTKTLAQNRTLLFGQASQRLLEQGVIKAPTGLLGKTLGVLRPGPTQDALWAADNLAKGVPGAIRGFSAVPKLVKFGIPGALAAAGIGYMAFIKGPKDAKQAAEAAAAAQQGAAQAPGTAAGTGAIDPAQLSAQDRALLEQFAAMPAQQQAQIIQQQYAQLQQAMQAPNMTAEQQQQVAAAQAELQLLMQVSNGASQSQAQVPAPAATAPTTTAPNTGAFTAQGLGLAP